MTDATNQPTGQVAAVAAAAPPAIVVPDYLKNMTGANQGNSSVDSMAAASMSIPRISMRGKKFRFIEGGEEIFSVSDKVSVVIFGVEPDSNRFVKTYYDRPYGGTNDSNPPACASDDGVVPSGWISQPQHPNCAECPKNRFGSATSRTGKPSKACHDSKRLWVARHTEIKVGEKPTLYAVGVTVMSLKSLAEFGRSMKSMNVPISSAITEIIMDDDSEFPQISFKCIGFLPEAEALASIERAGKSEWKLNQPSAPRVSAPSAPLPGQVAAMAGGQGAGATIDQPAATPKSANMDDITKTW